MTAKKENKVIRRFTPFSGIWILVFLLSFASLTCTAPTKIDSSNDLVIASTPTLLNQNNAADQHLNTIQNEVNGIGIGASYKDLTERFGRPHSEKKGGKNPCGGSKTVLRYQGIAFTVDDDGENNIVVVIEVTSPTWEMVPGVRTGMTLEQIRTKMGRNGMHKNDEEVESLVYADGDGYLDFQFGGGKVVKITRELNMC